MVQAPPFYTEVLDYGYVKYIDAMGDDLTPLAAARMSTNTETGVDTARDDSLRDRLWRDAHTSPFEMAELVLELQCPIFVLRQIDRHRTLEYAGEADVVSEAISVDDIARRFMSRNEFSGRYSVMPDLMYVPQPERVRGKSATNKQGSGDLLSAEVRERFVARVTTWHEESRRLYDWAVEEGIANELARIVLPPTQYTRLQLKGSLLSWLKFLALRLQPDVQWESREYARAIAAIVQHEWPKCWQVFCKHTLGAAKLSADEVAWLKENVTDLPEKLAHKLRQATLMLETYS